MEDNLKIEADCSSSTTPVSSTQKVKPRSILQESFVNRNKPLNDASASSSCRNDYFYLKEKLACIKVPTVDLPPLDKTERKFSSRSRLYIGNLPPKVTQESIAKLFAKYSEIRDVFINETKNFAFVKLDYYINALKAKTELNGYIFNGKHLTVRFAQGASILVKHLPPNVSDELLNLAFSAFGDVEYCNMVIDPYGKPTNRGIVYFAKRGSAILAKKVCEDHSFFITSSLKPVVVEDYEPMNDLDGYAERQLRKTDEYYRSRKLPPRIAQPGTFEYDYGQRFKELQKKYEEKQVALKNEFDYEEKKLEAEMFKAQYDYETARLKDMLRLREMERERLSEQWTHPSVQYGNDNRINSEVLYTQARKLDYMLESQEQELQMKRNMLHVPTHVPPPGNFDLWRQPPLHSNYSRAKRPRM